MPTNHRNVVEPPDVEFVKESLEYVDGSLFWKVRPAYHFQSSDYADSVNRRYAGKRAGTLKPTGYEVIHLDGRLYRTHQLVWMIHHGEIPEFIDHINGSRADNRIENLRTCNRTENNRNAKTRKDNSSGVKGVFWHKAAGKWSAEVQADGKKKYLGLFDSVEDAAIARKQAANDLHGAFARHA